MRFLQSIGCLAPAAIVIYGVLGVLLLGQFGGQALNYLRSMGWEQMPGTVVSSEVEDAWDTTGERYAGRVVYTYEVDGVTYEGNQLDLRGSAYVGNREDAERLLLPYPVGASVMLYVNPADPARSVLDRSVPSAIWAFVGLGSVLMLLSLGLGIRHFANRHESP
jgi:hypothetical protein